jgi:aminopeptidase YwaD
MDNSLTRKAEQYLHRLCVRIGNRAVGSPGNVEATEFFRQTVSSLGWEAVADMLDAMDWDPGNALIEAGDEVLAAQASPYSKGCESDAELVGVSSLHELETADIRDKNVLLFGDIAREQLMPKNFVFYHPEEHARIIALLEAHAPACIISATGRNSALAGGAYPFPLIEDGDFDIPSVFLTDVAGNNIRKFSGKRIKITSTAARVPSKAYNVSAIKKRGQKRLVITAHIDAKKGTPGAIDNATGVTVILLLAELLSEYAGNYTLELVAFNGEDYYAVPGQMDFIRKNEGLFDTIDLNINIDGQGYLYGKTSFSFNGLPDDFRQKFMEIIDAADDAAVGPWWPQGDHSIFAQFGVPAVAVSSLWFLENMENQTITHTPADNLGIVDYRKTVQAATMIAEFVQKIS